MIYEFPFFDKGFKTVFSHNINLKLLDLLIIRQTTIKIQTWNKVLKD